MAMKLKFVAAKKLTVYIEEVQKTVPGAFEAKAKAISEKEKQKASSTSNDKKTSSDLSIPTSDELENGDMMDTRDVLKAEGEKISDEKSYQGQGDKSEDGMDVDEPHAQNAEAGGEASTKIVGVEKNVHGVQAVRISKNAKPVNDGIYILRSLGNGKHETINLFEISLKTLQAKGAGRLGLNMDLDRANSFFFRPHQWTDIIEKCALAARYSGKTSPASWPSPLILHTHAILDKHIFNFLGLPRDLRFMVYDLVALSEHGIGPRDKYARRSECFKILHLNQEIRNEVIVGYEFFKKNNFFIQGNTYRSPFSNDMPKDIANNLQHLTFEWEGRVKEVSCIAHIGKTLPHLKTLHISFGRTLARVHERPPVKKANKLHQDDKSIKKFSVIPGFDKLVLIRGVDSVKFSPHYPGLYSDLAGTLTEAEVNVFEAFLNTELTQEKPKPVEVSPFFNPQAILNTISSIQHLTFI